MSKQTRVDNSFAIEAYESEEAMCKEFWREVEEFKILKLLSEHDIHAISNNQRTSKVWLQKKDKAIGVTKGVADYGVPAHGYMEAKIYKIVYNKPKKDGTSTISVFQTEQEPEQKKFQLSVEAKGLKYAIFRTPREGIDILLSWGVLAKIDILT